MKNLIILIIAVIVLSGIGLFATQNKKSSSSVMVPAETKTVVPSTTPETTELAQNYQVFSPTALVDSADTRRVLFFYANWCPTCTVANADFLAKSSQLPSDVTLIRVNYNDTETDAAEKELAKKYFITYQHTFVQIDAQGNELVKWNGGEMEQLVSKLK